MNTWLWGLILVAGVLTFSIRYSFIYLVAKTGDLPPRAKRVLAYVPPAVFAALVIPEFVAYDAGLHVAPDQLTAGVVAAVVAYRTENLFATILSGMLALWTLRFLL